MKKTFFSLAAVAAMVSMLSADALIDQAKKAGLKPIPADKKELMKLIDNPKNPVTDAKVALGRNFISNPDFPKAD